MLLKFLRSRNPNVLQTTDEKPLMLQIIHAGGAVERYYMAFPASWIMDKHPNFVVARPEVFRRPWDSVVRPEEILVPGERYFVVPIPTVRKLRKRLLKPMNEISKCLICEDRDTVCSRSLTTGKYETIDRCVKSRSDSGEGKGKKNGKRLQKYRFRFSPSLTMIDETLEF